MKIGDVGYSYGIRYFERGGKPAVCSVRCPVAIPDSVTEICPVAFSGCTSLESVTFSGSLRSVLRQAFSGCLRPQYAGESLSEIRKLRAVSRP